MPQAKNALILFIKNPIPGRTKTRLAASVGDDMALRMYKILTDWTRDQAAGLQGAADCYLYYSNFIDTEDDWPASVFTKMLQEGDNLGDRMAAAFDEVFARGYQNVAIIGSDCPGITTEYLGKAFAKLEQTDVVIGPAEDGGYTLLGMRGRQTFLFSGITWSTEEVLPQTIGQAKKAGLSHHLLPTLIDVDHLEDWYSYGWTLPLTEEEMNAPSGGEK